MALPTHTPAGKPIFYYQSGKKPEVYGVRVVDPKTGELGESAHLAELREKYPQYEFRHVKVSPELETERLRWREKEYEKELAERRAEVEGVAPPKSPSETWEDYIAKYGTKARIPSTFIQAKYRKELEAASRKEAVEPEIREKEYFVRPVNKRERIFC